MTTIDQAYELPAPLPKIDREGKDHFYTVVRTRYLGPTNTQGTRLSIRDMKNQDVGLRSRNLRENLEDDRLDLITEYFGDDITVRTGWTENKGNDVFYIVEGYAYPEQLKGHYA